MNIFVLDEDPCLAAYYYHDVHIRKMCTELSQVISNAYTLDELKKAPLTQKGGHRVWSYRNHPVCVWARQNLNNFEWALKHAVALSDEFQYRFNKIHFCSSFIFWCAANKPSLANLQKTEHPQCFKDYPSLITPGNPVEGYRKYYNADKLFFMKNGKIIKNVWTKRPIPFFIDLDKYYSISVSKV